MCKITKLEEESHKSDEDYKPESEVESVSGMDDKKHQLNKESHLFDPEKQNTQYNMKPLPTKIPVIEINERATETASYYWLARYESIPSNSPFNRFLNKFKNGVYAPKVAEFEGVQYRFLQVGTNARLNTVRQYY